MIKIIIDRIKKIFSRRTEIINDDELNDNDIAILACHKMSLEETNISLDKLERLGYVSNKVGVSK